jgi:hypothetical protein
MPRRDGRAGAQGAPASVRLCVPLPEDALVPGELELICAHLAGLLDRVIPPELDSDPDFGGEPPWP